MLNICLVGCGGMAANYSHRYTQIPEARLALLIDINEETAKSTARRLGVERFSTNFQEALAPDIDIVDISTPNHLHAEQSIAALRAGKHIFLQKPIAPSLSEALAIVETARDTGMKAGLYMSMLDNPMYHDIKKMMDLGLLGEITAVHCRGAHKGGLKLSPDNWRNSVEKTGGGSFIQLASHHINMIQWLLSSPIVRVASFSRNRMCPNLEGDDSTAVICEFANGIPGTLETSYCSESYWITSIYGSKGYVHVINDSRIEMKLEKTFAGDAIIYSKAGDVMSQTFDYTYETLNRSSNPYDQHIIFVEAIRQGTPIPVPIHAGLRDLKVVKAVYKSAAEKRFVDVDEMR